MILFMANKKSLANELKRLFTGQIEPIQIPIETQKKEARIPLNKMLRIRGFTFMLIGAAIAYLEGQRKLSGI